MYSMMSRVNNIIYLKIGKRINFKCSHKKIVPMLICMLIDVNYIYYSNPLAIQGIHISKSLCGTQANTMLYVSYASVKLEKNWRQFFF